MNVLHSSTFCLCLVLTLGAGACASDMLASRSVNPIARLRPEAVAAVSVQPLVVNRTWIEITGTEGGETFMVVHSPERAFFPPSVCRMNAEDASALVALLAHAVQSASPPRLTLGSYTVRIQTVEGSQLVATVEVAPPPGQSSAAIVVGDRQYLLDSSELQAVQELIGRARCP